ncbi:MAG: class F sortase [Nitriliruptor sp.]
MRRLRPLLVLVASVTLITSCATSSEPAQPTSAASSSAEDEHADHDRPGNDDADVPSPTGGPGTTDATLQQMLSMDPEVLASPHDHGDGHDHEAREHPNGIDPERIVIPAIDVDADVIDLGLQDDGTMEVPSDFAQTGWFDRGPQPGRVGPAVIAGHVDDRSGPAVFYDIAELEPGDRIEVHGEGETVVFEVRETQQHPKDDFPTEAVYGGTPGPELRLITCSGEFDRDERSYRDNTIVFAERVE